MQFAVFAWGKFRTAELKTLGGQTRMQRYWLWVTRPQYYLEPDGTDRRDIDPLSSVSLQESWTCHKDTKKGDWALLYRTSPKCDIAYLMRVGSDAYSLAGNPDALQKGWSYGCAIRVIHKFRKPLPLATLRDDPVLQKWGALRCNFQGIAFPIESQYWQRLSQLLCGPNPEFVKVLKNLERDS